MKTQAEHVDYDVFLSHNSADKPEVEAIGRQLREKGLRPFLDKWHLVPGKPWQKALTDALDNSQCAAIFFGPSGNSPWRNEELQIALNKAVRTRDDYRVIPVILPGADLADLGFLELRTWVDFRPGLDDTVALKRLVAAVQGIAPDEEEQHIPDEPRPYRGLSRFDDQHSEFFFGRGDEIQRLIDRMNQDRFVAVVGASGCGKSSLVRAGLSTKLAEEYEPGIGQWRRINVVPGGEPVRHLAAQLAAPLPGADRPGFINDLVEACQRDSSGLLTSLLALFPDESSPVLLLLDQLEEVFTHRMTEPDQIADWRRRTSDFAANLLAVCDACPPWIRVVITIRADFVDRFVSSQFPEFRDLLERRQFWLGDMSEDDLREAIVFPAKQRGAFFEKGLVELILRDMAGQTGALPLLEEALEALWVQRRGAWLTIDAYQDSGGVGGALAKKAESIFSSLNETDRSIAQRALLGLVHLGDGVRDTRRRVAVSALVSAGDDVQHVTEVLGLFAKARLITLSSDQGTDTAEITHEALIYHWERIGQWLDECRDDLRLQRRLEDAARRWNEQSRPEGSLWRPPELDLLRDLTGRLQDRLTRLQIEFYSVSEKLHRSQIRLKRLAIGALVALAVLATTGGIVANSLRMKTKRALEREILAHMDSSATQTPAMLERLRSNRDISLPLIRDVFDDQTEPPQRRLRAAMGLAALGQPPCEYLVNERLADLPAEEMENFQAACEACGDEASTLLQALGDATDTDLTCVKAASVLIYLDDRGSLNQIANWFAPANAERRTSLVHEFHHWVGDTKRFATWFSDQSKDTSVPARLQAAFCLAVGFLPPPTQLDGQTPGIVSQLQHLARTSSDGAVHSSAEFTLKKWNVPASDQDSDIQDSGWYRINVGNLTMVRVGPGQLMRRAKEANGGHESNVQLRRPFWISTTEVTNELWVLYLRDNPDRVPVGDPSKEQPLLPATNVSWEDAVGFCNWLSTKENKPTCYTINGHDYQVDFEQDGYRLPTEAEWEYACRGSAKLPLQYCFGSPTTFPRLLPQYAWFNANAQDERHACAGKLPNAFGLFDMHGNVLEWCWDWYDVYPSSPQPDYAGPTEPQGLGRCLRGGGFYHEDIYMVASDRSKLTPTSRNPDVGFRVVRTSGLSTN